MPYIPDGERRVALSPHGLSHGFVATPATAGELNYQITCCVNAYLASVGQSYCTMNTAIGALECAKQELYRRVLAPYEDTKLQQHGDVYAEELLPRRTDERDSPVQLPSV